MSGRLHDDRPPGQTTLIAVNALDTLACRIRAAHEGFQNSMRNALRLALDAGDALIEAKTQVPDGTWHRWLKDNCFPSIRTAQLYIQLAQHREEIESELERVTILSLSAARRLIMSSADKSDAEPINVHGSASKPDAVIQLLPFWQAASDTQRSQFLAAIGLPALLAAMSEDMRNELEQREWGSLKARCKTKKGRALINRLRKPATIEAKATEIPAS
jgi:hypothetical protein